MATERKVSTRARAANKAIRGVNATRHSLNASKTNLSKAYASANVIAANPERLTRPISQFTTQAGIAVRSIARGDFTMAGAAVRQMVKRGSEIRDVTRPLVRNSTNAYRSMRAVKRRGTNTIENASRAVSARGRSRGGRGASDASRA